MNEQFEHRAGSKLIGRNQLHHPEPCQSLLHPAMVDPDTALLDNPEQGS